MLGLPGVACCGPTGCIALTAAPDWAPITAAGWSVLVLAPCGLGLIPISSNVQIEFPVELTKERGEERRDSELTSRYLER